MILWSQFVHSMEDFLSKIMESQIDYFSVVALSFVGPTLSIKLIYKINSKAELVPQQMVSSSTSRNIDSWANGAEYTPTPC